MSESKTSPVLPLPSPQVSQSLHPAPLLTILSNMPPSALIQAIPLLVVSLCSKFQFSYQISLFALTSLHRMSLGSIALCHTEVPGLVLGLLECWWGGKGLGSLRPCLAQTQPSEPSCPHPPLCMPLQFPGSVYIQHVWDW